MIIWYKSMWPAKYKQKISYIKSFVSNSGNVLLLRKDRLFIKSRYSRNRQWSKSIVYFGLWFNLISVLWSIYFCYRYVFVFSYLYWLIVLVLLLISGRNKFFVNSNYFFWLKNVNFF